MDRADDGATPLGLKAAMNTFTPGSRWRGNPGLVCVTPSAYSLCQPPLQQFF